MSAAGTALVRADALSRHYLLSAGRFRRPAVLKAVDGVSFDVGPGKTLAVVGESGCGKSTLGRLVSMIEAPTSGTLALDGRAVVDRDAVRALRTTVQMVFQDPFGSLNPRQKVGKILEEPLAISTDMPAAERRSAAQDMLRQVGLRPEHYGRYPHMFSGGQRQRIAIARALMLRPKLVVADEPVSALDVSVQAQILNLMMDLQETFGVAYLFISHDLSVVRHIADDVMVMYLGRAVEYGKKETIFAAPRHPYTRALLVSTPSVNPQQRSNRAALEGELPSPIGPPAGCAFHSRCPYATDECVARRPVLRPVEDRRVACHYAEDIAAGKVAARRRSAAAAAPTVP